MGQLPIPTLDALPLGAHCISVLTDDALFDACGVRVAFSGRAGGVSAGPYASLNVGGNVPDDPADVSENRLRLLDAVGAAGMPAIIPNQVHGTHVAVVREADEVERVRDEVAAGADALVVRAAGVAALMASADCLLCIVVSPSGCFAVVHAGWRGALAGIAGKAARLLAENDEYSASEYNAYIGPHIRTECFEVGLDVADRFAREFGEGAVKGQRHVDLAYAVTHDLVDAGLERERIADACICTVCNSDRFFSYRASGGQCGRQAAIALRR